MEEPAFLPAVQRIVGRVKVQDDLVGRALSRLEKQINQQSLDRRAVVSDLVVEAWRLLRSLQTVQRRFAGDRSAIGPSRLQFARQHGEQRIVSQSVMVVQVLIAQRQAEYPLTHERRNRMLDQRGIAPINKTARGAFDQLHGLVRAAQQQSPGVRRHRPPAEIGDHLALFHGCKFKQRRATLCLHRGIPAIRLSLCRNKTFR